MKLIFFYFTRESVALILAIKNPFDTIITVY